MIQEKYLDTVPEYIVWSRFNCLKLLCTIAWTGIKTIASLELTQIVWQTFLDEAHKYCVMVLTYFNFLVCAEASIALPAFVNGKVWSLVTTSTF